MQETNPTDAQGPTHIGAVGPPVEATRLAWEGVFNEQRGRGCRAHPLKLTLHRPEGLLGQSLSEYKERPCSARPASPCRGGGGGGGLGLDSLVACEV